MWWIIGIIIVAFICYALSPSKEARLRAKKLKVGLILEPDVDKHFNVGVIAREIFADKVSKFPDMFKDLDDIAAAEMIKDYEKRLHTILLRLISEERSDIKLMISIAKKEI